MAKESKVYKSSEVFGDYLLMLLATSAMSVWYYGISAVRIILACVLTSIVLDFIASLVVRKQYYIADLSAPVAGAMIAMMLPAGAPLYVGMLACAFAVLVIKVPFGGGMRAPFVPAAAGFASAAICFRNLVFTYGGGRDYMNTQSIGSTLAEGGSMSISPVTVIDIITGNFAGPMGTTCVAVFIGCLLFMLIRRKGALLSTLGFLGACVLVAVLFPRNHGSLLSSVVLELSSGSLLFAAVFMLTDYSTLPKHVPNRIVYGAFTGFICMFMRHLGAFEEPVCFAVLLGNAFSPLLDQLTDRTRLIISSKFGRKGAVSE